MTPGRFTKINDGFTCENCHSLVPPAVKTCRDHCPFCLTSKHVDIFPGDRAEACQGLMDAVNYEISGKKGLVLVFRCRICGAERKNVSTSAGELVPDNYEKILALQSQNPPPRS